MDVPHQRTVRVALIGAGHLSTRFHYPSLRSLPDVELVAVADLVPERAAAAAQRFGIPASYGDFRQMLAETDPEVVYVVMPPQHLMEPAGVVLDQGRHLFVEKPLGLTTWQARGLAHRAEARHCLTAVGFQRRFVPALTELRGRLQERGPIHHITVSFLKCQALTRPAAEYGGVIDLFTVDGIHAADLLRFLGGEVRWVSGEVRNHWHPGPFPDSLTALISFQSGAVGIWRSDYATGRRLFRVEMHGRGATAEVDPDADALFVADNGAPQLRPSRSFGPPDAPDDRPELWLGFWHEARHFIDCVQTRTLPCNHFGDALKSMELVERVLRASA